ncbi:MAG TPA: glycerophosphodiester phosphodiesterase, partial [Nitrospiria bacterium]|nr:glycerophosphodiester phosphodiesterase [Nitrospiria bacterium]
HLGLLTRKTDPVSIRRTALSIGAGSVHMSSKRVSKNILKELHKIPLPVFVYTVNSGLQMRRLLKKGADGFFTDYPGRLTGLLKTRKDSSRR